MGPGDIGLVEHAHVEAIEQLLVMPIAALADRDAGDDIGNAGAAVHRRQHYAAAAI